MQTMCLSGPNVLYTCIFFFNVHDSHTYELRGCTRTIPTGPRRVFGLKIDYLINFFFTTIYNLISFRYHGRARLNITIDRPVFSTAVYARENIRDVYCDRSHKVLKTKLQNFSEYLSIVF